MRVKPTSHINEDSILASFKLIWQQQMVWLIESIFQFSRQSNFLNERTPLGTQNSPSKAVQRPTLVPKLEMVVGDTRTQQNCLLSCMKAKSFNDLWMW